MLWALWSLGMPMLRVVTKLVALVLAVSLCIIAIPTSVLFAPTWVSQQLARQLVPSLPSDVTLLKIDSTGGGNANSVESHEYLTKLTLADALVEMERMMPGFEPGPVEPLGSYFVNERCDNGPIAELMAKIIGDKGIHPCVFVTLERAAYAPAQTHITVLLSWPSD